MLERREQGDCFDAPDKVQLVHEKESEVDRLPLQQRERFFAARRDHRLMTFATDDLGTGLLGDRLIADDEHPGGWSWQKCRRT